MSQAAAETDALDRELALFKETVALTNPLTYGHKGDWYVKLSLRLSLSLSFSRAEHETA
ncbi:hypothetical protein PINS_up002480 [Pythium insidiosum]|nr:hypothetical protein PINS_up002480 [Pythium insidiosum]